MQDQQEHMIQPALVRANKYTAEVTAAHSSELTNHHMTNITRSQFTKLNLNLKKLIIIKKTTMGMSFKKGEAALEKRATNNKARSALMLFETFDF